jgi:sodium-dependent dicarboxylate transporter 2/3/5
MGTTIGTAPNLILVGLMGQEFGSAHEPTFTEWFAMSAPVAVLLILMTYVVVVLKWCRNMHLRVPVDVASQQLEALGSLGRDEKVVLFILAVQIALWFSRRESFPGSSGWSEEEQTPWRGESSTWGDGGVALMGAFVLFLIPSGDRPGEKVLTYRMTKHLPWDIIVLMGGGFAIAEAVTQSGTAEWLADHLGDLAKVRTGPAVVYNPHSFFMTHRTLYILMCREPLFPLFFVQEMSIIPFLMCLCTCITFMTEICSNTATATIVLPVLIPAAEAANIHPLALLMPTALACSTAFMLPSKTPANACT